MSDDAMQGYEDVTLYELSDERETRVNREADRM